MIRGGLLIYFAVLSVLLNGQISFVVEKLPEGTPSGDTIFITGSFNNWRPDDPDYCLRRVSDSLLGITLPVEKAPFEYKFTRGNWNKVEGDPLGNAIQNRKLSLARKKGMLQVPVFIRSWEDLPPQKVKAEIRVIVDALPENTPPDASIYIVGSFNSWHPGDPQYKMERLANGLYQGVIPIREDTIAYKFTRGSWQTIEGRRSGRARFNRVYIHRGDPAPVITAEIQSWEDLSGSPINTHTLLLLLAAIQGLVLIIAINTVQDYNRAANRVLSVLILLLSIALIGRVSTYDRDIFNQMPRLLLVPDMIYFLYAPVFLMYIQRLLHTAPLQISWKPALHFIPFVLHLAAYLPLIFMEKTSFINKVVNQEFRPVFVLTGGVALLYNTLYWVLCHQTINKFRKSSDDNYSFEQNLTFLNTIMYLKAACLTIWSFIYMVGALGKIRGQDYFWLTDQATDMLWIVFSLTVFLLGYFAMRQPEIFKMAEREPKEGNRPAPAAGDEDEEFLFLKKKLPLLMAGKKPYLNPKLTLANLAELLDTNTHTLSRVINEGMGMNFNDYVNSYRVEAFKERVHMEEYQNHTLLAIAFMVGFNSKTAFNRSFKKLTGQTPREYAQKQEA